MDVLAGTLLVLLAFGGLLVASLAMAVGDDVPWLPTRRWAAVWALLAFTILAVGASLGPPDPRLGAPAPVGVHVPFGP